MKAQIRVCLLTVSVLMSLNLAAETSNAGKAPCQCRDREGLRRDLGSVDCFDISGTRSMFRCEMSTNTPYWKRIDGIDGCPLASVVDTGIAW